MVIGIVNYGVGNCEAIVRMFDTLGIQSEVAVSPAEISTYSHLVLPGVGNFGYAASRLRKGGWICAIQDFTLNKSNRVLGICLGAQLLGKFSEESEETGLDLLPIKTVRIATSLPVPHVGWKVVTFSERFLKDYPEFTSERYYFSHSFEMRTLGEDLIAANFTYDGVRLAAVHFGNITAVQFHPEKSHRFGKKVLKWFALT